MSNTTTNFSNITRSTVLIHESQPSIEIKNDDDDTELISESTPSYVSVKLNNLKKNRVNCSPAKLDINNKKPKVKSNSNTSIKKKKEASYKKLSSDKLEFYHHNAPIHSKLKNDKRNNQYFKGFGIVSHYNNNFFIFFCISIKNYKKKKIFL